MKKTGKLTAVLLVIVLLLGLAPAAFAAGPQVSASAAVVLDYDTGEWLYWKDGDTPRVPASMTKIMTAYILYQELEAGNITKDTAFTISDNARAMSRDSSYPTAVPLVGETVTVDQLLGLIMVPSASASCLVAAENVSGSEAAFVERMNENARILGMKAQYQNCHGARPHYVAAESIARLIREFITRYPDILNYTSLTSIQYNGRTYNNTNRLLTDYYYEGVDGFKTGTITEAGYCLSASAVRNGRRLISVVMNASNTVKRHTDSIAILDYGFEEAARRDAARETAQAELICKNPLRLGCDVPVLVRFTELSAPFTGHFTLTLNEDPALSWDQTWDATPGGVLEFPVELPAELAGQDSVEAVLEYALADGSARRFTASLPVSHLAAPAFRDVAWSWAEAEIQALYNKGLLSGYPDGTFQPEEAITRGEFACLADRLMGKRLPQTGEAPGFTDMAGHWAEAEVSHLAAAGVLHGQPDGSFDPEAPVTREESAALIAALLQLEEAEPDGRFPDEKDIAPWAAGAIAAAVEAGLISGYPDGSFCPAAGLTGAESAHLLLAAADRT